MSKIKSGDKVAVYFVGDNLSAERVVGYVDYVENDLAAVNYPKGQSTFHGVDISLVHVSQCKKLKPKKKHPELWVNLYPDMEPYAYIKKEEANICAAPNRIACVRYVPAKGNSK